MELNVIDVTLQSSALAANQISPGGNFMYSHVFFINREHTLSIANHLLSNPTPPITHTQTLSLVKINRTTAVDFYCLLYKV